MLRAPNKKKKRNPSPNPSDWIGERNSLFQQRDRKPTKINESLETEDQVAADTPY